MSKSYYFIPGFDPVGPARYVAIFRDALRKLAAPQPISLRRLLNPSRRKYFWDQYVVEMEGSLCNPINLCIADYTRTIRLHWCYSALHLSILSLQYLGKLVGDGLAYCFSKDYRVTLMVLLQLIALQSVLLISFVAFALIMLASSQLTGSPVFAILSIVILAFLPFLYWQAIDFFKIPWLFKAFLFQQRLSKSADLTLFETALELSNQLQERESFNSSQEIYLISHSSGLSLLLMVVFLLEKVGSPQILNQIKIITYGRSMPLFLGDNILRSSLDRILESSSYQWIDVIAKSDYLADLLVAPRQYLDADDGLANYPKSFCVNYRTYIDLNAFSGCLPWVLLRQFSIHFDYLTHTDSRSLTGVGPAVSMPLLLWDEISRL